MSAAIALLASGTITGCLAEQDCDGGPCEGQPVVLFILDSSGSMELKSDCECETLSCAECMPDCAAGERSRWMDLTEAMAGSFVGGNCTAVERTEANGFSFDVGYYRAHSAPPLRAGHRDDGILTQYATSVHFGVATFDGWDTYLGRPPLVAAEGFEFKTSNGVDGLWSYGSGTDAPRIRPDGRNAGEFSYPGCGGLYQMDTGIRSADAENGGLIVPLASRQTNVSLALLGDRIARTRPWGGTPIAAALDDIDAFLRNDEDARTYAERSDARVHIVLIADGKPDDDYHAFGCDCVQNEDPDRAGYCDVEGLGAAAVGCPYPLADVAARNLRCGWKHDDSCDDGTVEAVHVIAFATDGYFEAEFALHDVAAAGGTQVARRASSETLRAQIAAVLDDILR